MPNPRPQSFEQVIALLSDHNERILMDELENKVHVVSFEVGKIEIGLTEGADPDIPKRLYKFLNSVTGEPWTVSLAMEGGKGTPREEENRNTEALHSEVARHPLMQSIMENFPGAEIESIRKLDGVDEIPPGKASN